MLVRFLVLVLVIIQRVTKVLKLSIADFALKHDYIEVDDPLPAIDSCDGKYAIDTSSKQANATYELKPSCYQLISHQDAFDRLK